MVLGKDGYWVVSSVLTLLYVVFACFIQIAVYFGLVIALLSAIGIRIAI